MGRIPTFPPQLVLKSRILPPNRNLFTVSALCCVGMRLAFRIEYYDGKQIVMAVACLLAIDEATAVARENLKKFKADSARIRDMDKWGQTVVYVDSV